MQVRSLSSFDAVVAARLDSGSATVPCEHGVTRELLLIGLVLTLGILAVVALVLPAFVSG